MLLKFLLALALSLFFCTITAQETPEKNLIGRYIDYLFNDSNAVSEPKLLVYPTLGFAPETSWEIGLSSLYVYYAKQDTANRLSEINGFTFYTFENQYGFWLDHALYSDRDKWFFLGRVRYQSFPLLYYGQGSDAPSDYLARVDGNFLLIKERVLRELWHSFYLGLEIDFQHLFQVEFNQADPENPVEIPLGGNGSTNLGVGLGLVYDNRHNVLNVRKGLFSELAFLKYDKAWGSDFDFTSVISDNRIFRPVNKRDVIAAQLFGQFTTSGQAPFNQLALMGGESLMRGYYLGRFRDDNLIAGQVEYRFLPFSFLKRWGATAFLSAGQVFSENDRFDFSRFLPAGGAGIRFLLFPDKDIYVRFDVAFTREGTGFYFFIGEAF